MTTFSNIDKSAAPTFSNESRNNASWTSDSKSGYRLFGEIPLSEIEENTFDGLYLGRPLGDWAFDDMVPNAWQLIQKS